MYNVLYKGPRPKQMDVFTAYQLTVDLNPKPFINREELRVYQKKTKVATTALTSHTIKVSKPCPNATVACQLNRDRPLKKESVQHQNKTRCLSAMDKDKHKHKRMATSDAHLRQHPPGSGAWLDKRRLQRDTRLGVGGLSIH